MGALLILAVNLNAAMKRLALAGQGVEERAHEGLRFPLIGLPEWAAATPNHARATAARLAQIEHSINVYCEARRQTRGDDRKIGHAMPRAEIWAGIVRATPPCQCTSALGKLRYRPSGRAGGRAGGRKSFGQA